MEKNSGCNNWYALFVVTGEEENVKIRLNYRFGDDLRVLVPKRKIKERKNGTWHESIRTLFPGYVFIHGSIGVNEYFAFKDIPGIIRILSTGYEPQMIPPEEMGVISRLTCNGEVIGSSSVLIENQKIIVADGPLKSLEGQITSINKRKGRAKVIFNFLGELKTVELGVEVLQPAVQ